MDTFTAIDTDKEAIRLKKLREYNILDTLTEKDYDDITFMASIICDVPIALISFVDEDRQWFKSHKGLPISETSREYSICAQAILIPDQPLVVSDLRIDDRFQNNPFVTGEPNIVFYAGIPLVNENGLGLGTVCVIDTKPRVLSDNQLAGIKVLSAQVMNLLEMRKNNANLKATQLQSEIKKAELEKAARKLEASEAQLRTLSEGMNVFLAMGDASSKATFFTKAWATLTGKSIEELLDYGWADLIHPEDRERYVNIYTSAFEKHLPFSGEFRILNKWGNYTWLLSQGSPQILPNGTFIGYISSTVDISGLKQTELELSNTTKRLLLALKAGKLGSYELNLASGNMKTSLQCRQNYGFDATEEFNFDMLLAMIVPDDLPFMHASVNNSIAKNTPYDTEYRIKLADGEIRWIHASGLPVYDHKGQAVQMTGVTLDVTEQKLFKAELEKQVIERTVQLEDKNLDLERMNKELQSFAYISSHDLQEPSQNTSLFATHHGKRAGRVIRKR